jgi:hypothetical protein
VLPVPSGGTIPFNTSGTTVGSDVTFDPATSSFTIVQAGVYRLDFVVPTVSAAVAATVQVEDNGTALQPATAQSDNGNAPFVGLVVHNFAATDVITLVNTGSTIIILPSGTDADIVITKVG